MSVGGILTGNLICRISVQNIMKTQYNLSSATSQRLTRSFHINFHRFQNLSVCRIFPRKLTIGGFLIAGYCSRTISYCFPHCFVEIFVGRDEALMEGDKVVIGGSLSPSPPTRENLVCKQSQW